MENIERRVGREVRAMTRREVITKAIAGQLSWVQATEVLAITPRQLRRIRRAIEQHGMEAVMDHGSARRTDGDGESRPGRSRCCRLKRDIYPDFSVQHFYEQVTKQHANVYDADIFNCSHLTAPK